MSIADGVNKSGLVERVKAILLKPVETWNVIALEPATTKSLYMGYAVILAAIGPIARLIGGQVFGYSFLTVTYRPPLIGAIVGAIFSYVLSLVMIFVLSLIIDALAPSFDGQKSQIQALKVAVYSYTAAWVASIFTIFPALSLLSFLGGLYSLYLLYLGLPKLMNAPQAKALGYTAVCVIVAIILSVIAGLVVGAIGGFNAISSSNMGRLTSTENSNDASTGTLRIGGASVDLDKLKAASQQMAAVGKQMTVGAGAGAGASAGGGNSNSADAPPVVAVPAETLKGYLPDSVAGYSRGDISSSSGGVAGLSGSSTEAEYAKGDAHLTLSVTDLGSAGGFAALVGVFGVESSKETATGYEKIGKVDGRMTTEEWDRNSKTGKFGVLVANRFMVQAEGNSGGVDMDDLKAAVKAVGPDRLERLAKN